MATDLPDEAGEFLDELAGILYGGASALNALAFKAQAPETKQALREFLADPVVIFDFLLLDEEEEPEPDLEEDPFNFDEFTEWLGQANEAFRKAFPFSA